MIDLFSQEQAMLSNVLPFDGKVEYYGCILNQLQSDFYYQRLLHEIQWQSSRRLTLKYDLTPTTKVAFYASKPSKKDLGYRTVAVNSFNGVLQELLALVQKQSGQRLNHCELHLFSDGYDTLKESRHKDPVGETGATTVCLSFGATRKYHFQHKHSCAKVELILANASLVVVKKETKSYWRQSLPPTKLQCRPRICLYFTYKEVN